MADTFCLDPAYSTTRLVTREKPVINKLSDSKLQNMLFLPPNPDRKDEGGLRTKDYFKQSSPDKPLISVITVVANGEKHLEETIRSVINQTYDNVEYIIIDGGSTDGTVDIIRKYEDQIDYWVSEPDSGIYDAMNKATSISNGNWLYFIGADDVLYDCFANIIKYFISFNCIYYGNIRLKSNQLIYAGKFNLIKLLWKNLPHQAIFYPKSVFINHTYNLKYNLLADYYLNLVLFTSSYYSFRFINILIAEYNDISGKSSEIVDNKFKMDKPRIIMNLYPSPYKLLYLIARYIKNITRPHNDPF
jgi:glycosyltransferase involved in cell wall biosynthesis